MGGEIYILGGGIAGLTLGHRLKKPVFEAEYSAGGLCQSYFVKPGAQRKFEKSPPEKPSYRFELGGGHWIFGSDRAIIRWIDKITPLKAYKKKSAVFFIKNGLKVPFPVQHHMHKFDRSFNKHVKKYQRSSKPASMREWLLDEFGDWLCEKFFFPFHKAYTAGLYEKVAPQDVEKTPGHLRHGEKVRDYNTVFYYPRFGLQALTEKLKEKCFINYGKRLIKVDAEEKVLYFSDGTYFPYKKIYSSIPLNRMSDIAGITGAPKKDPYTSVLVMNVGGLKGKSVPREHWLYFPDARSGFYRVGFYTNVHRSFLNDSDSRSRISMYVERAYPGGKKPSALEAASYIRAAHEELKELGFIKEIEVCDTAWIDVAYTWSWPGSRWRENAIRALKDMGITQLGRYGLWKFQGIADSIKQALVHVR